MYGLLTFLTYNECYLLTCKQWKECKICTGKQINLYQKSSYSRYYEKYLAFAYNIQNHSRKLKEGKTLTKTTTNLGNAGSWFFNLNVKLIKVAPLEPFRLATMTLMSTATLSMLIDAMILLYLEEWQ